VQSLGTVGAVFTLQIRDKLHRQGTLRCKAKASPLALGTQHSEAEPNFVFATSNAE